jgi:general secretion pathway protein H
MARSALRGFTLIEILVVALVIGLVSGIIVINLASDEHAAVEREARRLAGALEHAAALAQWQSETLGVSADGSTYRFWRRAGDATWTPIRDEEALAPRALPSEITVMPTSYAGGPVPLDAILPFRPSGRNEPYALMLSSTSWSLVVSGDPLNRVHVATAASR